jgi:hypothetical protein
VPLPQQPQAASSPGVAKVHSTSTPPEGAIYIDGKFFGNAPSDIALAPAEHGVGQGHARREGMDAHRPNRRRRDSASRGASVGPPGPLGIISPLRLLSVRTLRTVFFVTFLVASYREIIEISRPHPPACRVARHSDLLSRDEAPSDHWNVRPYSL